MYYIILYRYGVAHAKMRGLQFLSHKKMNEGTKGMSSTHFVKKKSKMKGKTMKY
jgi:hypothetical protein